MQKVQDALVSMLRRFFPAENRKFLHRTSEEGGNRVDYIGFLRERTPPPYSSALSPKSYSLFQAFVGHYSTPLTTSKVYGAVHIPLDAGDVKPAPLSNEPLPVQATWF